MSPLFVASLWVGQAFQPVILASPVAKQKTLQWNFAANA